MRKPQDFIVYPVRQREIITIQSDKRIGQSTRHGQGRERERLATRNHDWLRFCVLNHTAIRLHIATEEVRRRRGLNPAAA